MLDHLQGGVACRRANLSRPLSYTKHRWSSD